MKKLILSFVAIIALTSVNAQTWKSDGAHSSVNFSVSHFLISDVTGNFGKFEIEATANAKFENPTFTVSIEAASINTNQSDRDNHLRSPDFFNVEEHAIINFKSESFKQLDDKNFETKGDISINGVTKEVVFNGKLNGVIKDDRSGKHKAGLKLTTSIMREDFNLGKGMSPIGKEVEVTVNLEMNEQ